jgi:ribosomal protein L11 methyltransferase
VEAVSDALMDELDALSVSVEDSDADTDAEKALFGEPGMPAPSAGWQRSTLKALFETEAAASEAATLLLAQDWATQPGASVSMTALHEVEEQDWVRLTQSQFDPVEITPEFWIVPTWHQPPAGASRVIRLDPGMAFGTGTHPTTRMCLGWIAAHEADIRGRRVLDYGCGSGILAIGAALHGGAPIDAVDIDPAAIATTAQNAADNDVTLRSGAPDMASGHYRLVLANILATPLKMLAPLLCGHVAAGGHLVLAGILDRQADELKAAYAPWIALEVSNTVDGWILMTGHKPA